MKRVFKWTKRIFFILVGVVLLTKFLSTLLFSILINTNYKEYGWKGGWKSDEGLYHSGYTVAHLPYSLPILKPFKGDAVVFEHFYSFEHTFSSEKMKFTGCIYPIKPTLQGVTLNDSLSIGFQANLIGEKGHQIELNGCVNLNRTLITGSYRSTQPYDMGTFSLSRR